jgi:membrane-bound metal-dependent hydrolase YbcI (DUF457 family)
MNGAQHVVIGVGTAGLGFGAAYALGMVQPTTSTMLAGAGIVVLGSLAVDIDHPRALISRGIPLELLARALPFLLILLLPVALLLAGGNVDKAWASLQSALQAPWAKWALAGAGIAIVLMLASKMIADTFGHRGALHSLTFTAIMTGLAISFSTSFNQEWWWGLLFGWGWLCHVLADSLTPHGVPLLWPLAVGRTGDSESVATARRTRSYTEAAAGMVREAERRPVRDTQAAEEGIDSILNALGDDYLVVRGVATPHGNIDYVVIAKHGGVFLIETKAQRGQVSAENGRLLVNGNPEDDFIAQTLQSTQWLRDRMRQDSGLSVWVTSIIAFTNAWVEPMDPIKGVHVMNRSYLRNALCQPNHRSQNRAAWDRRDEIFKAL